MSNRDPVPSTREVRGLIRCSQHILTKGDNNEVDDVVLYPLGRQTVMRHEVVGLVTAYVPFLGWLAIAPRDVLQNIFAWTNRRAFHRGNETYSV